MAMIKLNIDDRVKEKLELEAEKLGMRLNAYIQFVLGLHVAEKQKHQ